MTEILILSAGRRVSLLRSFQAAADKYDIVVTAADMDPSMSSACQVARKHIRLPHVDSKNYADALLSYCANHDVRMVVPTIDTELATLASLSGKLAGVGCAAVVSDPELIDVCRDKRKTAIFFKQFGIKSPEIFSLQNAPFPVFVKPYDGSLSKGAVAVHALAELTSGMTSNPKNIYCEYLDPAEHDEYTCDAYFDSDGTIQCVVPRLRLEVRGGEVSKGRTSRNNIVPFLMDKLRHLPGARGCLTIQIMRCKTAGTLYLIEVNPRFGGGYPLTARSGAAYHTWLIDEYLHTKRIAEYNDWTHDLTMLRYDAEIFIEA
jgi:carbamoyl-phosphate synthase large subunit